MEQQYFDIKIYEGTSNRRAYVSVDHATCTKVVDLINEYYQANSMYPHMCAVVVDCAKGEKSTIF